MTGLDLEQEIGKMARAMMARNTAIGDALIAYLRIQLTEEEVAGIVLVSLERLLWLDGDLFIWTLQNFLPQSILNEMRRITSVTLCKQLIGKKFLLGEDFSVNANGQLLLNTKAKKAIFSNLKSSELSPATSVF